MIWLIAKLRRFYIWLIHQWVGQRPITIFIQPLHGAEPEDVFVGHLEKVQIVPFKNRAYFELTLAGPLSPEGYKTIEVIDFKALKWNRTKGRLEALKSKQPVAVSSPSEPPRTSDPESFWRSTTGPSSMMGKRTRHRPKS